MNKVLKICAISLAILAVIVLVVILIMKGENKRVATKEDEGVSVEHVIIFKKDKIDNAVVTTEYENKEEADKMVSAINFINSLTEDENEKITIEQEDNKVILKLDAKHYEENMGADDMPKAEWKAFLEEQGFKVK